MRCKERIELIANTLELEGFSRIDAFVNVDSGEVCRYIPIIEMDIFKTVVFHLICIEVLFCCFYTKISYNYRREVNDLILYLLSHCIIQKEGYSHELQ